MSLWIEIVSNWQRERYVIRINNRSLVRVLLRIIIFMDVPKRNYFPMLATVIGGNWKRFTD